MTNIFADSKIRLSQAKRHIVTLKSEIKSFLNNYASETYIIEDDPLDRNYCLHKIKITKPPSDEIIAYTTDAIDNLRAALDLAWRNLAVTAGFVNPNAEAPFPFADNLTKFESMFNRGFTNFSQDVLSIPMRFKPYKGGDNPLWALNRICAANKHRLLPMKVVRYRKIAGEITKWGPAEVPANMGWDNGKNEIVFFRAHRNTVVDSNIRLSFDIIFDKSVDVVGGEPAVTTLNALVDKVEQILLALEDAALRLGLIT